MPLDVRKRLCRGMVQCFSGFVRQIPRRASNEYRGLDTRSFLELSRERLQRLNNTILPNLCVPQCEDGLPEVLAPRGRGVDDLDQRGRYVVADLIRLQLGERGARKQTDDEKRLQRMVLQRRDLQIACRGAILRALVHGRQSHITLWRVGYGTVDRTRCRFSLFSSTSVR